MSKVNNITFVDNTKSKGIGMFCKVCNYIFASFKDAEVAKEYECCEECYLTFVESRKKEWKNGWRPDKVTIRRYKDSRKILINDFKKVVEEIYESEF
jgi:hypothetical protein